MKTIWDFVESYYPNYSSSDEILHNEDLLKLIEERVNIEESPYYHFIWDDLLEKSFGIEPSKEEVLEVVKDLYNKSLVSIYEQAIKGYILSQ